VLSSRYRKWLLVLQWRAGSLFWTTDGTNEFPATNEFDISPPIIALKRSDEWTFGTLINQTWLLAGNPDRPDSNQMFQQTFAAITRRVELELSSIRKQH